MSATPTMETLVLDTAHDGLSNDARGMILSIISASACVLGAAVVCVDLITKYIPRWRNFRIQDSDSFLAASLSLSFGVMIFSSLFNILPSSREYLVNDGYSDREAGLLMIMSFGLGAIGIGAISRFIHQFMPSHVVDCDHEHNKHGGGPESDITSNLDHHFAHTLLKVKDVAPRSLDDAVPYNPVDYDDEVPVRSPIAVMPNEETPLLNASVPMSYRSASAPGFAAGLNVNPNSESAIDIAVPPSHTSAHSTPIVHRLTRQSSVQRMGTRVISFITDTKANCDASGPCFGYRDPCGNTCFKVRSSTLRLSGPKRRRTSYTFRRTNSGMLRLKRTRSQSIARHMDSAVRYRAATQLGGTVSRSYGSSPRFSVLSRSESPISGTGSPVLRPHAEHSHHHTQDHAHSHGQGGGHGATHGPHSHMKISRQPPPSDLESQVSHPSHHHHVSTRPFLSIGLQTSIAIGLHKLPEGFITYASNHASPSLGFAVFFALLVHNIAEGFSLALPLYLALGSRKKAIAWSTVLGGLSQPLGAGVAAMWFKWVSVAPSEGVYGVLFAVTAGIMVGVGLQLFGEGLALRHDKDICVWFAFLGMAIMGISGALVGH